VKACERENGALDDLFNHFFLPTKFPLKFTFIIIVLKSSSSSFSPLACCLLCSLGYGLGLEYMCIFFVKEEDLCAPL
jgi:hypothetical protein